MACAASLAVFDGLSRSFQCRSTTNSMLGVRLGIASQIQTLVCIKHRSQRPESGEAFLLRTRLSKPAKLREPVSRRLRDDSVALYRGVPAVEEEWLLETPVFFQGANDGLGDSICRS